MHNVTNNQQDQVVVSATISVPVDQKTLTEKATIAIKALKELILKNKNLTTEQLIEAVDTYGFPLACCKQSKTAVNKDDSLTYLITVHETINHNTDQKHGLIQLSDNGDWSYMSNIRWEKIKLKEKYTISKKFKLDESTDEIGTKLVDIVDDAKDDKEAVEKIVEAFNFGEGPLSNAFGKKIMNDIESGNYNNAYFVGVKRMMLSMNESHIEEMRENVVMTMNKNAHLTAFHGQKVTYDSAKGELITYGEDSSLVRNSKNVVVGVMMSGHELVGGRMNLHFSAIVYYDKLQESLKEGTMSAIGKFIMGLMIYINLLSHISVNKVFLLNLELKGKLFGMMSEMLKLATAGEQGSFISMARDTISSLKLFPNILECLKIDSESSLSKMTMNIEHEIRRGFGGVSPYTLFDNVRAALKSGHRDHYKVSIMKRLMTHKLTGTLNMVIVDGNIGFCRDSETGNKSVITEKTPISIRNSTRGIKKNELIALKKAEEEKKEEEEEKEEDDEEEVNTGAKKSTMSS
jgi:hypothetical protein